MLVEKPLFAGGCIADGRDMRRGLWCRGAAVQASRLKGRLSHRIAYSTMYIKLTILLTFGL